MDLESLNTPAFLIDLDVVAKNTALMRRKAWDWGVRLRPHVKTHKTIEGARLQVGEGFQGIAVSTIAEARFFAQHGFDDIIYAVPVSPGKLPSLCDIAEDFAPVSLVLDHPQVAAAVEQIDAMRGIQWPVYLKVDCGYHRCGVDPNGSDAIDLARHLTRSQHLDFQGILTHGGQAYQAPDRRSVIAAGTAERDISNTFRQALRRDHVPCPIVSIGSTPTLMAIDHVDGIDEIRPGNYVFFDASQVRLGSCRFEDCAAFVWSTVIGVYPQRNQIVFDAGAIALSKDAGPLQGGCGPAYGVLAEYPNLTVTSVSQEHGCVAPDVPIDFDAFAIGQKVRIIPMHSCLAAAAFRQYHVVSGDRIVDVWHPISGW